MLLMCGLSQYDLAFYHLISHAFFKALLFLVGGVIIVLYKDQDLRKIKGVRGASSFLFAIITIGSLALDGFYFFSSLDSKDCIIELSNYTFLFQRTVIGFFSVMGFMLTISYNSCVMNICAEQGKKINEKIDVRFIVVLTLLALLTIFSVLILYKPINSGFLKDTIFTHFMHDHYLDIEHLPF